MSKHIVTHSCGHESEVNLFGPTKERERKLDWLETVPCYACKKQREREEEMVKQQEAVEENKKFGAAPLIGTTAQIALAETLRHAAIVGLVTFYGRIIAAPQRQTQVENAVKATIQHIQNITESSWWCKNVEAGKSEKEILVQVMLASPYLTEEVATILGLGGRYRVLLTEKAVADVKKEEHEKLRSQKPTIPEFWAELKKKHNNPSWNGKIYSSNRIYLNNTEIRLTPDQASQLLEYSKAHQDWYNQMKKENLL